MRKEPKIGTKAPEKKGGTGGGLSKAAVAEAAPKAAKAVKAAKPDPKRHLKMEVRRNADAKKYL